MDRSVQKEVRVGGCRSSCPINMTYATFHTTNIIPYLSEIKYILSWFNRSCVQTLVMDFC